MTQLKSIQQKIPHVPGVYIFYNKENKEIYIGKAKNLYKRTAQYFQPKNLPNRIKKMVFEATNLKYHITQSENEAFLLEAQLIKQHQPIYNIIYKTGRSLYYLHITNHAFPKLEIINEYKENAVGPFLSYKFLEQLMQTFIEIFQIRNCSNYNFSIRKRPCLQYHINQCSAPCVNLISQINYIAQIEKVKDFLNGKTSKVLKLLTEELKALIKAENFEEAAKKQQILNKYHILQEEQNIIFPKLKNVDCVIVFENLFYTESIRNGKITNVNLITFEKVSSFQDMLFEYYHHAFEHKIIGEVECEFENYTNTLSNNEQDFFSAAKLRFLNLIKENLNKEEICSIFKIKSLNRIEIYDNSHYAGKFAHCAMAVSNFEKPLKNLYKKWKMPINTFDDLAILEFGLKERLKIKAIPDLIIIDGGLTQLAVAKKILPFTQIIAFTKTPNRKSGIVYNINEQPIEIADEKIIFWLENLRSLAHNYAKSSASNLLIKSISIKN